MKRSNAIIKFLDILIILFFFIPDNIYAENIYSEKQFEEELGKLQMVGQINQDT